MPHLVVKKFKEVDFPKSYEDFRYEYIATNFHYKNEKLLCVQTNQSEQFFLVVKEDGDKTLIKSDKTTRPAAVSTLHKALEGYAKIASLEIVHSNIPHKKYNPHLKETSALKTIEYFAEDFPQNRDICIEIGFGSGRHLLYQAKSNPKSLFIGLEIHRPSIEQVLKQINIQGLENILLIDYDARLFLEQVPSNVVSRIYVHFPVPWDKKPHRRVISKNFVAQARRVLKVGGRLELRTDSENYYAYSYETFMGFNKIDLEIKKNKDIAVSSKYEDRWKRMEKNIYDITMICDEESKELRIEGSFDFGTLRVFTNDLVALYRQKIIEANYFVHFERIYGISKDDFLMKVSLGSFDRPEHLYLRIKQKSVCYVPHSPLRSHANIAAHKKINEVLCG